MDSRWMQMERVSIVTHSFSVGLPSRFVATGENRRSKGALKSRDYVGVTPVGVSYRVLICDESKSCISKQGKHAEARGRSQRFATLSSFTEYKNRSDCGIRPPQSRRIRFSESYKVQRGLFVPFCCGWTNLGVYENEADKQAVGVNGLEFKKESATRFCSFDNEKAVVKISFENASNFEFSRKDNENLLPIRSKFCESNIKRGRVLPVLLGSTVLFLFLAINLPKTALAQESQTNPASPVSEEYQHHEMTPEVSVSDEQNLRNQTVEEKTADMTTGSTDDDATEDLESKLYEAFLEEYVESHPTNIGAHKSLFQIYLQKGEVKGVLRLLDKLTVLQPDNLEWKYLTAQAYDISGDAKAALEAFKELSELRPLSARIMQGLVVSMQKTGEDPAAIVETLQKAVNKAMTEKKTEEARNLCMLLGQTLTLQGKLEDALTVYKQLEQENSEDFRPFLCQGLIYSLLGKDEEAENYFTQYRKLCPTNFPNRGPLDELMLKAKVEARKFQEHKQKGEAGSTASKKVKPMKQPNTIFPEKQDKE